MRRPVAVVAALLCAACASAPAAPATPRAAASLPAARIAAQLAVAQQDVFDDRYAAADSAYAQLLGAAPQSADVHAAMALFLSYRGDLADALAQAQRAVALDGGNGRALAVLARVRDWSGQYAAAVTAGRQAVAHSPGDALPHLFLAEALADIGDRAGSQAQIDAASPLIARAPSAFLEAEAQRETANLDADSGSPAAQVAALQRARDLQSSWLYRTTELVGAEITAGQDAAARQALDAVSGQTPDDAEALAALGRVAFSVGDAPAALSIWTRALSLSPADPATLDMAGEADVAANNDINAAVADFEGALGSNPHDDQAAAYLLALARYVQKQPALGAGEIAAALSRGIGSRPMHPPPQPRPDELAAVAAQRALGAVNAVRAQAGLGPVRLDARLSASASSHAYYWLFNNLSASVAGLGIHQESAGLPGYTGVFPWTRATAAGYPNERIGEDITHRGDASAAVRDWVDSVFHRFPVMRPDLVVIGYGEAHLGSLDIEDMEFGFAPPAQAAPVVYPAAEQSRVPAIFVDNELPDPVPAGAPRTTGYPVTVTFAAAARVTLASFTLAGPDGHALDAYVLSPSSSTENSASLLPAAPLQRNTVYTAHVVATVDGARYDTTWSFTTAP